MLPLLLWLLLLPALCRSLRSRLYLPYALVFAPLFLLLVAWLVPTPPMALLGPELSPALSPRGVAGWPPHTALHTPVLQALLLCWLAAHLLAINATAAALYAWDKRTAMRGDWRVPEATLLTVSLLGGSPAAYITARRIRHKTRKATFRRRYFVIAAVQAGALLVCFIYLYT